MHFLPSPAWAVKPEQKGGCVREPPAWTPQDPIWARGRAVSRAPPPALVVHPFRHPHPQGAQTLGSQNRSHCQAQPKSEAPRTRGMAVCERPVLASPSAVKSEDKGGRQPGPGQGRAFGTEVHTHCVHSCILGSESLPFPGEIGSQILGLPSVSPSRRSCIHPERDRPRGRSCLLPHQL